MFRDLYKSANDEIKGNRALLDKAFARAEEPEKKPLPVLKYSFVGTAVAAVIIFGAVFSNSNLFMDKITDVPQKESVTVVNENREAFDGKVSEEKEATDNNEAYFVSENTVSRNSEFTEEENNRDEIKTNSDQNAETGQAEAADINEAVEAVKAVEANVTNEEEYSARTGGVEDEYGIATVSMYEDEGLDIEQDEAWEEAELSTEQVVLWSFRRDSGSKSAAEDTKANDEAYFEGDEFSGDVVCEEDVEDNYEEIIATESASGDYSTYMGDGMEFFLMEEFNFDGEVQTITEDFANVDTVLISTGEEAVERAENEIEFEYDKVSVYYISSDDLWIVVFKSGENCRCVYIGSDGITQLILDGKMVVLGE